MEQIQSTGAAFAALKTDGSVVVWGHPIFGGDARAVQEGRLLASVGWDNTSSKFQTNEAL